MSKFPKTCQRRAWGKSIKKLGQKLEKKLANPDFQKLAIFWQVFRQIIRVLELQSHFGDNPLKFQVSFSPNRDCGPKRVKNNLVAYPGTLFPRSSPFFYCRSRVLAPSIVWTFACRSPFITVGILRMHSRSRASPFSSIVVIHFF